MNKTFTAISLMVILSFTGFPGGIVRAFDGNRAFKLLKKQVAFGPRNPGSPGHLAGKKFLLAELSRYTSNIQKQEFMHYDPVHKKTVLMTNIIARFNPQLEARILLCAHWDSRPFADQDPLPANRKKAIPGANDGASGVAVLLEIARQLKVKLPPIGVDIVLFDGEDFGREGDLDEYFQGSRYFTKHNSSFFPKYAILLDMVGDAQLFLPVEGYSSLYAPDVVKKVWEIGQSLGYSEFSSRVNGYIDDDHVILNKAGIPAIDIIDFAYPDASNKYWHTLQDTPDKCSPRSLKIVGDVLLKLVYTERP